MPELVLVDGLSKQYRGSAGGVREVTLTVASGEIVGLLGPNGSGKTTALHCITGIIRPDAGVVLLAGLPHDSSEAKDVFGFLPDDLPMPDSLRAAELIALFRRLRPSFDARLAHEWLEILGLAHEGSKYFGEYSHGMKRKLQLVLALAHRPRLLILDEPLRGLDPEAAVLMLSLMEALRDSGAGVLVSTHDLAGAERFCTEVVIISAGRVISQGSPAELMSESGTDSLERHFIATTGIGDAVEAKRRSMRAAVLGWGTTADASPRHETSEV